MNMAEKVFEEVRDLPEFELREVLDFVGFLKTRHGLSSALAANDQASTDDVVTDWTALREAARELMTEPTKAADTDLMKEVRGKICLPGAWTRDELYDRGIC